MNHLVITLAIALVPGIPTQSGRVQAAKAAGAGPAAVVTFRPTAEVAGRAITLADVAAVEGVNRKLVATLEAVEVGVAPISAHPRLVSADYAKIRIRAAGVDTDRLQFSGPPLIEVKRLDQLLLGSAIDKTVREAVEAANPGLSAYVSVAPRDLRLPVGAIEIRPQIVSLSAATSGAVPVQVLVDGRQEATLTVGVRLVHRAPVLVAARDLPVGTTLTEADVKIEERAVLPGPLTLSSPDAVIGQQTALPIKAGSVFVPSIVRPAILVKRGSRVVIQCKGSSFTVSAAGEALQDGAAGQVIRVKNSVSLLEISGRVVGPDQVVVQY